MSSPDRAAKASTAFLFLLCINENRVEGFIVEECWWVPTCVGGLVGLSNLYINPLLRRFRQCSSAGDASHSTTPPTISQLALYDNTIMMRTR